MIDVTADDLDDLDEEGDLDEETDDELADDDEGAWGFGAPGRWCVVWTEIEHPVPGRNGTARLTTYTSRWDWFESKSEAEAAADVLADNDPVIVDLEQRPRRRWEPSDRWARAMRNPDRGASMHDYNESNLRAAATRIDNVCRGRLSGVTWNVKKSRWRATVKHEGRVRYLGSFVEYSDAVAAVAAYKAAAAV